MSNRKSIEERLRLLTSVNYFGDWKVDTIVGKVHHQAIYSLAERKSRLALLRKVNRRTAESGSEAMIVLLQPIADLTHTITRDNGKGFGEHERTTHDLAADFFFAHLYIV